MLKEKEVSTVKVTATVEKNFKDKCDYICEKFDIKLEDYLGELLQRSEVQKVYKALMKDDINVANETHSGDIK